MKCFQAPPLTDPPPPAPTRPPPPPPTKPVWPIVGAVLGCVLLCGAFGLLAYYIHRRYIKIHHPFREWEVSLYTPIRFILINLVFWFFR